MTDDDKADRELAVSLVTTPDQARRYDALRLRFRETLRAFNSDGGQRSVFDALELADLLVDDVRACEVGS